MGMRDRSFQTSLSSSRRHLSVFGAGLVLCWFASVLARGQAVPPPPSAVPQPPVRSALTERKWFRIGYLRPDADAVLGPEWYRGLKHALLGDPTFRDASRAGSITGVALRPAMVPTTCSSA